MNQESPYPVGTPGQKWGADEKAAWLARQSIKRSYRDEVLSKLETLKKDWDIAQYGALSNNAERYPLYVVRSRDWSADKATVLVTGGVHGYETSGVQGAIRFLQTAAPAYSKDFNIMVTPCISPWGYETINRWNPLAIDPNRSFVAASPAEESAALMQCVAQLDAALTVHIDLHETTDTDNTEFRPALAARDAVEHPFWEIPDGFYLVGDTDNPADDFQAHIIAAVEKVTHIAPADAGGRIIGELITQAGVINYATKALGLCTGFSNARFCTTTEVYPDSPEVDDENCILAQVAAVTGGLDYVADQLNKRE